MTDAHDTQASGAVTSCLVTTRSGSDALALTLMCSLALTSIGLSMIPVVADQLRDAFGYSDSQIGLLTSVLMFALGAVAIPSGLAAARWGGRVLALGFGLAIAGSLVFAFSASYGWFIAARLIQGIGTGVTVPAASTVIADSVVARYRGRAWGIFGTGHGLGVMVALLIMPSIVAAGGYRAAFSTMAGLSALVGLAVFAQAPARKKPPRRDNILGARLLVASLGAVLTNRRVLLLSLFNLAALAIAVGALVWTPEFLQTKFGASLRVSAYLTAGLGLAQLVGNPLGAVAMARWGKYTVILGSMGLMTVCVAAVPFLPGLWPVFVFVTLAGFLTLAYFSPLFAAIPDVVAQSEQVGAASGLIEVFGFVGGLFLPWLFGFLLDALGSSNGYIAGYLLLAAISAVATVAALFFKLPAAQR